MSQPCMWLTAHKRSHFSRASIKPLSWFWHSLYKQNHIKIFLKCFLWGSYKKYLFWADMQKFVKWCIKSWRQYVQLWRFFCTKSANTRFRRAAFPVRLTLQFPFFHKSPWFFLRWKEYPCCHSTIRLDIQKPEKNLARSCEDVAYTYSSVLNNIRAISWDLKPHFPCKNITVF